jgi:hypothetical protein
MDKNTEILIKQKKQNELKAEVQEMKKKLPTYIIGFIFFVAVSLYFLEDKFYHFFGNSANFILIAVIILCLFSFLFILRAYIVIKKKQKESKAIGVQLYNLMKLEVDPINE